MLRLRGLHRLHRKRDLFIQLLDLGQWGRGCPDSGDVGAQWIFNEHRDVVDCWFRVGLVGSVDAYRVRKFDRGKWGEVSG
jgi:hypothetical protein